MVSLVSFFLLWHRIRRRRTDYDISWTFKEVILIKLHDNRKFIIQIQLYVLNSKRFPCHLMELRKNCYTKLWAAKCKRQRARKEKKIEFGLETAQRTAFTCIIHCGNGNADTRQKIKQQQTIKMVIQQSDLFGRT